jgi:Na+/H+-dicarboxylate symporter
MTEKKKARFSLSTYILIGMFLGIVCGIFFGKKVAFLQVAGDAFIKLLQMTILPYILVSLISGLGDARSIGENDFFGSIPRYDSRLNC